MVTTPQYPVCMNVENYAYFVDTQAIGFTTDRGLPPLKAGVDIALNTLLGVGCPTVGGVLGVTLYLQQSEWIDLVDCTATRVRQVDDCLVFTLQADTYAVEVALDPTDGVLHINSQTVCGTYPCLGADLLFTETPNETPDPDVDISDLVLPRASSEDYVPPAIHYIPDEDVDDDTPTKEQ